MIQAISSLKRCNMALPQPTKYLADWFVRYTKNRDVIFKKISSVREEGNKIVVEQKDGITVHYHVEPFPEDFEKITKEMEGENKGLIVYNSDDNFDNMIKAWKTLVELKNLTIYFVNPFSKLEKRWILKPYIHNRISDASSLKEGLNSMYIMVTPISKQEVEELTR
jgi:hypothetical protein